MYYQYSDNEVFITITDLLLFLNQVQKASMYLVT